MHCKPGYKRYVNLCLNPYIVAEDQDRMWFPNDIHEGPLHEASPVVPLLYTLCILAGISSDSFATPATSTTSEYQWMHLHLQIMKGR